MSKTFRSALVLIPLALGACSTTGAQGPAAVAPKAAATEAVPKIESEEILARDPVTEEASVKHILISWAALGPTLNGQQDPRAGERSRTEAAALIAELMERTAEGEDFEALMAEYSEDGGSARSGNAYPVNRDSQLAFMFRRIALRLEPGEQGVVKTQFGYHLVRRIE